jgi:hypothetical protein
MSKIPPETGQALVEKLQVHTLTSIGARPARGKDQT